MSGLIARGWASANSTPTRHRSSDTLRTLRTTIGNLTFSQPRAVVIVASKSSCCLADISWLVSKPAPSAVMSNTVTGFSLTSAGIDATTRAARRSWLRLANIRRTSSDMVSDHNDTATSPASHSYRMVPRAWVHCSLNPRSIITELSTTTDATSAPPCCSAWGVMIGARRWSKARGCRIPCHDAPRLRNDQRARSPGRSVQPLISPRPSAVSIQPGAHSAANAAMSGRSGR